MRATVPTEQPRPQVLLARQDLYVGFVTLSIAGAATLAVGVLADLHDWRGALPYALGLLTISAFLILTGSTMKQRELAKRTPRAVSATDVRLRSPWRSALAGLGGLASITALAGVLMHDLAVPTVIYLGILLLSLFDLRVVRAWEREHGATLALVHTPWRTHLIKPLGAYEQVAIRPREPLTAGAPR
jgi:hypothetical protein